MSASVVPAGASPSRRRLRGRALVAALGGLIGLGGAEFRLAVATVAGVAVGAVGSVLGVAGGELIIPALVLGFGVDVKTAGTLSVLIAVPTIVVGLARRPPLWANTAGGDLSTCVAPMAAGSLVGAAAGGAFAALVPGAALKIVVGGVLVGSALRMFRASAHSTIAV